MDYQTFLDGKRLVDRATGISNPSALNKRLFEFQRDIVRWALQRGRAAVWEDCGLGKSFQQLEWAHQVSDYTGGAVLIVAPLSVGPQTRKEGLRWGIPSEIANDQTDVGSRGVFITNYEKLHKFDATKFNGVALDESGILKSFDGATRNLVIEMFRHTPFRSAYTATPAPNDFMELGNHSEFIGAMSRSEMLSTFFVHDGGETSKWRLKRHAEEDYWRWICSWAVMIKKPSDLGYDDTGFTLPNLTIKEHFVEGDCSSEGFLFPLPVSSLQERREARRGSIDQRCEKAAQLAQNASGKAVIWCSLNDEQDQVAKLLKSDCVSIQGSTDDDERIELEAEWREGSKKVMVTKDGIFGWGMNWQHCDTVIYCGLSDSYEAFYQTLRRCWRFGQEKPVTAHIVISNRETAVLENIKRKQADADRMSAAMIKHMASISAGEIKQTTRTMMKYRPTQTMRMPAWI